MQRVILHSDLNSFYASVECLYHPELRGKPVAVGGDPELRHGIVLAKSQEAKKFGVATGEAIWQAKQKCPELIVFTPDYAKYLKFARLVRSIYADYSDRVEPFGLDEAWVDVTGSQKDGEKIANELRGRIFEEIGITASIGVSDNKIFAKLGSDLKKPDATTVITRENFRDVVWSLPAADLLYVGRSTERKLFSINIRTIGDIAGCDPKLLRTFLGKWGETLWYFANGLDTSPVARIGEESLIKSIGNSTTTPRDLTCELDVFMTMCVLCESVAARLREHGFKCRTVQIHVRDDKLFTFERQAKLDRPSQISTEILRLAMELFRGSYRWERPIRSVGVRGADLVSAMDDKQLAFFDDDAKEERYIKLERTVDDIRRRFGHFSIQKAIMFTDKPLTGLNPKDDHVIFPVSYFG